MKSIASADAICKLRVYVARPEKEKAKERTDGNSIAFGVSGEFFTTFYNLVANANDDCPVSLNLKTFT